MTGPDRRQPPGADDAYLDGLAGRPLGEAAQADAAQRQAHDEGRRLRQAVQGEAAPAPGALLDWGDVLAREAANDAPAPLPAAAAGGRQRRSALGGWAAAVLATLLGLWWAWPADDGPQLRGGGAGGAPAVWLSAQPQQDAQTLAVDLQRLGAQVRLQPGDAGAVDLDISAGAAARAAVDARLAALDTALDATGHLRLRVQDARASR